MVGSVSYEAKRKDQKLPPNKPILFYIRLDKVVQVLEKKRVAWFDLARKDKARNNNKAADFEIRLQHNKQL